MKVEPLDLPGLVLVTPDRHGDQRGFFSETYNARRFGEAGLAHDWVQDNHSLSRDMGVLRGLHYQAPPFAQTKLVRCSRGRIFDVAVDVRAGSPSFGRWRGVELSADNWAQLLVPKGFLHGFVTLEPETEVQYKVDAFYDRASDGGVAWDDPDIAVDWPIADPVLSERDAVLPRLADAALPFRMEETS